MDTLYTLTLTGSVRDQENADLIWVRVAAMMKKSPEAFAAEVKARLPMSLKAAAKDHVERQAQALAEAGIEVEVTPEAGGRFWLRYQGRTHGPVIATWLQSAIERKFVPDATEIRSMDAGTAWLPVGDWRQGDEVSFELDANLNQDTVAATAETAAEDGAGANVSSVEGILPLHSRLPGLYAGFWLRLVAALIDGLILSFGYYALMFIGILPGILASNGVGILAGYGASLLAYFIGAWLYAALFQSSKLQATPGMLALGLAVTELRGERIHFARATGRYFATLVSAIILYFGYFMIGWTQRKQALHDMLAGTLVVRKNSLQVFREQRLQPEQTLPGGGLPGWAIALIVVGVLFIPITAIVAAIAIPVYQDHLVRAQISEGFVFGGGAKAAVAEYYAQHGVFPAGNVDAGLAQPQSISGQYVASVTVTDGRIFIRYGKQANRAINGHALVWIPRDESVGILWSCQGQDISRQYLPKQCRGRP